MMRKHLPNILETLLRNHLKKITWNPLYEVFLRKKGLKDFSKGKKMVLEQGEDLYKIYSLYTLTQASKLSKKKKRVVSLSCGHKGGFLCKRREEEGQGRLLLHVLVFKLPT